MNVRLSGPRRRGGGPAVDRARLRRRAARLLRALELREAELSVVLAADPEIAALNQRFRGRLRPTDVLSFSLVEGRHADFRGALLGDVVLGVEQAERAARRRRTDPSRRARLPTALDDELARLLIHGVLHLLGHDHAEPEEAARMRAEERRLWKVLAS
jgi:probable rRNA maturation factor